MTTSPLTWPDILEHWRDPARPSDRRMFQRIAADLDVPSLETVRVWVRINNVPIIHWPRIIEILEQRYEVAISYKQLAQATLAGPQPKKDVQQDEVAA
jgi:hypothetical protein